MCKRIESMRTSSVPEIMKAWGSTNTESPDCDIKNRPEWNDPACRESFSWAKETETPRSIHSVKLSQDWLQRLMERIRIRIVNTNKVKLCHQSPAGESKSFFIVRKNRLIYKKRVGKIDFQSKVCYLLDRNYHIYRLPDHAFSSAIYRIAPTV